MLDRGGSRLKWIMARDCCVIGSVACQHGVLGNFSISGLFPVLSIFSPAGGLKQFRSPLFQHGNDRFFPFRRQHVDGAVGPGVAERFEFTAGITDDEVARWGEWRTRLARRINDILDVGAVMAIPTSPCVALFRGEPQERQAEARRRILTTTGLAGHAGLPQINIPYGTVDGAPTGLSIVGRKGGDEVLLDLARRLAQAGITRRP